MINRPKQLFCDYCGEIATLVAIYDNIGADERIRMDACDRHSTFPCTHHADPHASFAEEMTAKEYLAGKPWT